MHRRRSLGAVAGLAAATAVLAACQKPTPDVSVLSGKTYLTVTPSTYCFDASHCRTGKLDLPVVTAAADSKLLVDVPRAVKGKGWEVRALTLDGKKVLAGSGRIADSHSYKVPSSVNNGDPFIVEVDQLAGERADGSKWSFVVQVSTTDS